MKVLKNIAVQLFTGANVATILLLWLSCGGTYLNPATMPHFDLLALAFPVFLLVNLAFIPFWLIFKANRTWIPIVGIALCWSFVRDYCPINFSSAPADSGLKVLTYNTHNFGGSEAVDSLGNNLMMEYLKQCDADIICLQETYENKSVTEFKEEMAALGYECFHKASNMVLSRLPILQADTLTRLPYPNIGIQAWLEYEGDSILLVNVHFESNHLSPELKDAYRNSIRSMEQDSLRRGLAPVAHKLEEAAPIRAAQADTLEQIIRQAVGAHPVLICGDFNDTPVSYTHRVLTRQLHSAFRQSGNGLGFSFHENGFPVRIDHILYSPTFWTSSGTTVLTDLTWSDHYPLFTTLSSAKK